MEDRERKKLSVLSEFLSRKVKDKGWSKKEFAEKAGLEETYVYKLLGSKRDFTPTDETMSKIAKVLRLKKGDRSFIFDLVKRERKTGRKIYPNSLLSAFIGQKIKDKGWSVKKFAELCNINENYTYKLIGSKRGFTPTEETLSKIAEVLKLSDEEKSFVFDIARQERDIKSIIYSKYIPSKSIPQALPLPLPEVALSKPEVLPPLEPSQESIAQVSKEFGLTRLDEQQIKQKIRNIIADGIISAVKELGLKEEILVSFIKEEPLKIKLQETCPMNDIIIPEQYLKAPPKREKIQEAIEYYKKYGKFDKPLTIERTLVVIDGYKSYIAAKELGLSEIEANFISKAYRELSQPLQIKQEEKRKEAVPKRKPKKGVIAEDVKGKIKRVEYGQGYGFINGEDEEVYFFHHTGLKGVEIDRLEVEYRVVFDVKNSPKGPIAINIRQDI